MGERIEILAAARAAELLERACEAASSPHAELVRELARELGGELGALMCGVPAAIPARLIEAQLRAADLSNLAACALPELPPERVPDAAAAAHLAAGAARALGVLADAASGELEDPLRDNTRRDTRSAGWRARLAARQTDEALEDLSR
ncbi:hypothetical protein E0L93_01055 [Rubrobacter taiwanensis]|uniref:Cyclodeaminase/cyclohydrolase domain-containing protein n=1 Tax=Rubrobacter taiwanensis TaxID=185139 RepID=A0A4R1BRN5_9ACTN|nr:hypothetical protein [Rubrobacter taiwanensis]TCJ20443.1 hypothetical protein E0L93_01055 [Rubrobacter taiwanensis]